MKKIIVVLIFLTISNFVKAQRTSEIGVFFGQSFYLGDLNKERLFYNPAFSIGAFHRYILNPRYAVKSALTYGSVKGDNSALLNDGKSDIDNISYNTRLVDLTVQFEVNFRKFQFSYRKPSFTPYISGGLGIGFYDKAVTYNNDTILNPGAKVGTESDFSYNLIIPFGAGVKVNFSERLSGSFLWEFRKTFMDDLDGTENIQDIDMSSQFHNKDWYYFIGITLAYKINYKNTLCPAYEK